MRFLAAAGVQQSPTNVVGGKTGPSAKLLLESLQQAAFYSALDPIAWHFLRPVLTPAFQVKRGCRITRFDVIIEFSWKRLSVGQQACFFNEIIIFGCGHCSISYL